ncbi:MAG: hypothetical protein A4E23_00020 [Methanomethylovorans sp. PtaU1.Bin073]|nr:MAG: hypothetical protein A4E23_00020 [Methanomethylovorans sp. PtaU1.Bin073]
MTPELSIFVQMIPYGLTVIKDNLPIWITVLVLIGYLSKSWFDIGFYHSLYKPITKASDLEYWLSHALYGITFAWIIAFLLLIAWTIYAVLARYNNNEAAPILASLLILMAILLSSASSLVVGLWRNYRITSQKNGIMIILFSGGPIPAINVYADDGLFLYYINPDKTWSSIRKDAVASIGKIK